MPRYRPDLAHAPRAATRCFAFRHYANISRFSMSCHAADATRSPAQAAKSAPLRLPGVLLLTAFSLEEMRRVF